MPHLSVTNNNIPIINENVDIDTETKMVLIEAIIGYR